jgi:hypothetical protein
MSTSLDQVSFRDKIEIQEGNFGEMDLFSKGIKEPRKATKFLKR